MSSFEAYMKTVNKITYLCKKSVPFCKSVTESFWALLLGLNINYTKI